MSVLFQKTYILRILENMAYQILRKQKKALSLHKNLAAAWPTTTEQNKPKSHHKTGEALGKESMTTYHHLFKEESRFFLDYAFTNNPIKDFQLFEWDREISDHVGQLIEI